MRQEELGNEAMFTKVITTVQCRICDLASKTSVSGVKININIHNMNFGEYMSEILGAISLSFSVIKP